MLEFVPMHTKYINQDGHVSTDYVSLLPNRLTVDRNFKATRFYDHTDTLFKEVKVLLPYKFISDAVRSLFTMQCGTCEESQDQLFDKLQVRLKEVVHAMWDPECSHAIMHSSGLDSRMLSWTIMQLYLEHGDEWLGNTVFLCSKWEGNTFKRIMQYQGWDQEHYMVANENEMYEEYYAVSLLDFHGAWRWSNGASSIPVNLFWYPVESAKKAGLLSSDACTQLLTGMWGNEFVLAASIGANTVKDQFRKLYRSVLCGRPMNGDHIIHPYTEIEFVRMMIASSVRLGERLRPLLCAHMDEHLAAFVNENADADRHCRIAPWIIDRMVHDYNASWYGKIVRPGERPRHKTTEFQEFWSYWTSASLCEHLLQKGYHIDVE